MSLRRSLVDNAADPEQVERGQRIERDTAKQLRSDIADIFDSPAGRRYFWHLLHRGGAFHSTYAADTNTMFFNTGKREFTLEILADLVLAQPDALSLMVQERALEEKRTNG